MLYAKKTDFEQYGLEGLTALELRLNKESYTGSGQLARHRSKNRRGR